MKPIIGNVYCVFLEMINKYCAYQIIDVQDELVGIISLDYVESDILKKEDIKDLKVLYRNTYANDSNNKKGELIYANINRIPKKYIYVGNTRVVCNERHDILIEQRWPSGEEYIFDYYWYQISKYERDKYKEDFAVSFYKHRCINDEMLQNMNDWLELDEYVGATWEMTANQYYDGMIEFLERHHIIGNFYLRNHNQEKIDLRKTNIHNLDIDGYGLKELYLNDNCLYLHITGKINKDLVIHSCNNGKWLKLWMDEQEYGICNYGLTSCPKLAVTEIKNINISDIISLFKYLKELRLWGKPGYIANFNKIKEIEELEFFTTVDLFGFNVDDLPKLNELHNISSIFMYSLPKEVATHIKKTYKDKRIDLQIISPRSSEWLEKNMNNPFRDWDDREGIPKSKAKKASKIYNTTKTNIANVVKEYSISNDNKYLIQSISNIVKDYGKAFNNLDNIEFIETIEAEEIFLALKDMLSNIKIEALNDKLEQFYDDFESEFQN